MAQVNAFSTNATTLILNGHVFKDYIVGDYIELQPVNELSSQIVSADGGVSIQKRGDASVHNLVVRVQKFSNDDVFLNGVINAQEIQTLAGSIKQKHNVDGTAKIESYLLEIGSITTQPTNTKNDQEGNAVMEYTIMFRNAVRVI